LNDINVAAGNFGILDHVPVGVFLLRRDFVVLFWNACLEDWSGIQRDAIVGNTIVSFFPHLGSPRYASRLKDIFEGGPPTIFSSQLHHNIIPSRLSPKNQRIQHTVITSIQAPDGKGYDALFAIQDVTDLTTRIRDYRTMRDQALEEVRERKRIEAELIRTQEGLEVRVKERTAELEHLNERIFAQERLAAVGQLAAGIAHDFNNILTGIIGLSEIMLSESRLVPDNRQMVEAIFNNGLRAAHLIRQILDFSRKSISEMKPVELLGFLGDFTKFIKRTIPENIHITVDCQPGAYLVSADPTKIQQVLANLAVNARDAMPEGGELRFELSLVTVRHAEKPPLPDMHEGAWVLLSISDTGTGMTPAVFSHMFEPFFTTKEPGKGTGLGLSQVYGIIKQHDGFLDVKTEVGEGSAFFIYLPAAKSGQAAEEPAGETAITRGQSETILVVEDDETVRNLVVRSLGRLNFTIVTATNGKDALALFESSHDTIKVVITDLVMPVMGGIELSRAIREKDPGIRIIALTGYPLGAEGDNLAGAGIVECIQKPFQIQTLVNAVIHVLEL
jgi:signal transduction histidine kinase